MKKADVVDLVRYHVERDDVSFNIKASEIAREFEESGSEELAGYIRALISGTRTFVPQELNPHSDFLSEVPIATAALPLPNAVALDIRGIVNAISHRMGVNKFLFEGAPGTGKTEACKQVARILGEKLFIVNFPALVDSRLGATARNITDLFDEVNSMQIPSIVLFDEIDAIALDRVNSRDVREMGRVTSTFLSQLDRLSEKMVVIATTNLFPQLDKALVRRFDKVVHFDRYSHDDLVDVGEAIMRDYSKTFDFIRPDIRLTRKILKTAGELPNPGDLKNLIKTSIAFSDPKNPSDYLVRLYESLNPGESLEPAVLRRRGYTLREIETLTGIPRSTVDRMLKEAADE